MVKKSDFESSKTVRLALFAGILVTLAGCAKVDRAEFATAKSGKLQVVATTGPVGDAVRRIGGDRLAVEVMMGPGVDPHLYRAIPSDLRKLDAAKIIVHNGLHLEGRMAETFERLADKKTVIALADGLVAAKDKRLLAPPEFEGHYDPHVWHDVAMWSECIGYLAEQLAKADPDGAAEYQANAKAYRAELAALDAQVRTATATIPENARYLVTAHDAFAYFSQAYGLKSVGLKGVSTEDEIAIGRMDEVVKLIVENKIPAVFVETAVAPRVVEALVEPCSAAGHTVRCDEKLELYADALGPVGSGADSYAGMIRANVRTIVGALGGNSEQLAAE